MLQMCVQGGINGKPVTVFYHYETENKYFPAAAFVFNGNVKAISEARDSNRCMTLAFDSKSGNVSMVWHD